MSKKKRKKHYELHIWLLKESVVAAQDALAVQCSQEELINTKYPVALFIEKRHPIQPRWVNFIKELILDKSVDLYTKSAAAVLIIDTESRKFAITFGYGRNMLKPNAFEFDFGLKAAMNLVDPEKMKSINCREFDEIVMQTLSQASKYTSMNDFRINKGNDVMRLISGRIKKENEILGNRIIGTDCLVLSAPATIEDLHEICCETYNAYNSNDYKEHFAFYDYLQPVKDKDEIRVLESMLVECIKNQDCAKMHLATFSKKEASMFASYKYDADENGNEYDDIDIEDYVNVVSNYREITMNRLRKDRIFGVDNEGERHDLGSIYNCIVFETEYNGACYVIMSGYWFQIESDYLSKISRSICDHYDSQYILPDIHRDEEEGDYNARVATELGYTCLDEEYYSFGKGRDVEICDLYDPTGRMIFVKRQRRSSSLSHLFMQGSNSAQMLRQEKYYREFCEKVENKRGHAASVEMNRIDRENIKIVFAIPGSRKKKIPEVIPFFSRISLSQILDNMERMGCDVKIVKIEYSDEFRLVP